MSVLGRKTRHQQQQSCAERKSKREEMPTSSATCAISKAELPYCYLYPNGLNGCWGDNDVCSRGWMQL